MTWERFMPSSRIREMASAAGAGTVAGGRRSGGGSGDWVGATAALGARATVEGVEVSGAGAWGQAWRGRGGGGGGRGRGDWVGATAALGSRGTVEGVEVSGAGAWVQAWRVRAARGRSRWRRFLGVMGNPVMCERTIWCSRKRGRADKNVCPVGIGQAE